MFEQHHIDAPQVESDRKNKISMVQERSELVTQSAPLGTYEFLKQMGERIQKTEGRMDTYTFLCVQEDSHCSCMDVFIERLNWRGQFHTLHAHISEDDRVREISDTKSTPLILGLGLRIQYLTPDINEVIEDVKKLTNDKGENRRWAVFGRLLGRLRIF